MLVAGGGVGGEVAAPIAGQILRGHAGMSTRPAAVILDMEGVLHVDWQVLPGSAEAVRRLRAGGIELAVLTNTTGRTRR